MEVGIIAPVSLLKYCITDIQYCLPSLLSSNKSYKSFYKDRDSRGDLIIIDSRRIGWKRQPEDIDLVRQAMELLPKALVILPSYMFDVTKTLEISKRFLQILKPSCVAGCIEGSDIKNVEKCVEGFRDLGVRTIAIPSHIYRISKTFKNNGPVIYLDNFSNLDELAKLEGTLVTSLPIRLGLQGRLVTDYLPSPPHLTFEETPAFQKIVEKNIKDTISFYEE